MGALEAKVVDAKSIVTAAWVRLKCQYGCGGYDSSHCCPPNTPTPQQTREVIEARCTGWLKRYLDLRYGEPVKVDDSLERIKTNIVRRRRGEGVTG